MSRSTLRTPSASNKALSTPARLAFTVLVAVLSFLCLPATAGAALFSNATPITVPLPAGIATPYPSPIAVSGVAGPLLNVRATLVSVTDPENASEIDALLVAPNGQNVVLMSGVCGAVSDVTLTFDDSAATALDNPCTTGSYKPTDLGATANFPGPAPMGPYGTTLGPLGSGPNGTWNLYVRSTGNADSQRTIGGWSLELVDYIQPDLPKPIPTPRFCNGVFATIVGTEGTDNLRGTPENDVILGLGGSDSIKGGRGSDRICGSTGNDKLFGSFGNDRVFGGAGYDRLTGGTGTDTLDGGSSNDRCEDPGSTRGSRAQPTTFISCEFRPEFRP